MPIDFLCPHCQHQTLVADEYAGQTGPCSNCEMSITIPGNASSNNPYSQPMRAELPEAYQAYPVEPRESDAGMRMLLPVDRSALALIAGYLGLVSILCIPAPFAVVVGILAIRDIKKSDGKKHGLGRAWFAVIFGSICILSVLVLMMLSP